jgi:hypothetical protein
VPWGGGRARGGGGGVKGGEGVGEGVDKQEFKLLVREAHKRGIELGLVRAAMCERNHMYCTVCWGLSFVCWCWGAWPRVPWRGWGGQAGVSAWVLAAVPAESSASSRSGQRTRVG